MLYKPSSTEKVLAQLPPDLQMRALYAMAEYRESAEHKARLAAITEQVRVMAQQAMQEREAAVVELITSGQHD